MKRDICLMLVLLLPVTAAWSVDRYVATNGAHDSSFLDWANAATNIQAAVDVATNAGDYVYVSNGVYSATNGVIAGNATTIATNTVVAITNANIITLKSMNGPLVTIIDAGGTNPVNKHRGVYISSGATIDGFTVRNGYKSSDSPLLYGAGICLASSGGTVTNCIVYDNHILRGYGGGITVVVCVGKIDNCLIYSNSAFNGAGGVEFYYANSGSRLNDCVIWGNKVVGTAGFSVSGGGVYAVGNLSMRNCLIYSNSLSIGANNLGGGGVYLAGSGVKSIENCTITENNTEQKAGGVYIQDDTGLVRNSIIYNNFTTNASVYPDVYTTNNKMTNCCFGATNGIPNWNINGNINTNPVFADPAGYNYRLTADSPCFNAGANQSWMTNAVDLDGNKRIMHGIVDIGAYEFPRRGTIFYFR